MVLVLLESYRVGAGLQSWSWKLTIYGSGTSRELGVGAGLQRADHENGQDLSLFNKTTNN